MRQKIETFLKKNGKNGFITIDVCKKAQKEYELPYQKVEKIALQMGLFPLRFKRNQTTISHKNQLKLLNSHVAIIGCGGLGGYIASHMARIGVGQISIFDFDVFEEHNLNRQNFSHYQVIGKEKVFIVKEECEKINPALHIKAYNQKFYVKKDFDLIAQSDVIVDALDNPKTKLELAFKCKEKNVKFVHGAIAGFNAQFSTCNTLENLYKNEELGIETKLGNPTFTAAFAAALQSAEIIKILLGLGENLKDKILMANLLDNEFILLNN